MGPFLFSNLEVTIAFVVLAIWGVVILIKKLHRELQDSSDETAEQFMTRKREEQNLIP